ncbi:MAG: hypothetical protein H7X99_03545 [Saprospiraceae bacterium]|nr:hypothetical protein [Saprospiraceae bacterium]
MKFINYTFLSLIVFLLSSCSRSSLYSGDEKSMLAAEQAAKMENSCLVFRVPVQAGKIRYLKNALSNSQLTPAKTTSLKSQLASTIKTNNDYYALIRSGFTAHFDATQVYFVPDSLFKAFEGGKKDVFLNENNQVDPTIQCLTDEYFLMIQSEHAEQFLLVNKNGNRLDSPFPYKKNTFLPGFKRLLSKKKYMHNQIKWFNEKLIDLSFFHKKLKR